MGLFDKLKGAFSMSEEDYLDDVEVDEEEEYAYPRTPAPRRSKAAAPADNVVDMQTAAQRAEARSNGSYAAPVAIAKINSIGEVNTAADALLERKIVILNLETCADEDSRRIIDVLTGVAYANGGKVHRVALRTYIVTPNAKVTLSGEQQLLDEVVASAKNGSLY